ncbi:MAG: hypothetical protein HY586_03655 [Candidatus Omnitrophica bacterium]|nr:hypothetical protein [Candidatus Omnitrophota bacterium]
MWFDKSKKISNISNWAVILNPVTEEVKKRSAASQIQLFFSATLEEARELLENTPIILFDSLSEEVAEKVRDIFTGAGLDVVMTSETLVKRKCFRTVWPKELTVEQIFRQTASRNTRELRESKMPAPPLIPNLKRDREFSLPPAVFPKVEKRAEKQPPEPQPPVTPPVFAQKPPVSPTGEASSFARPFREFEEQNRKLEIEKARIQELLLDAQKENEELRVIKKDCEKLKKEIVEYRSQREQFEGAKIEYEGWVRELQEEKSKLEYRIRTLSTDLSNKENQYQDLRAQLEKQKDEIDRLKQELTKEIKSTKQYSETARKKESDVDRLLKEAEEKNEISLGKDQQIHSLTQKLHALEMSFETLKNSSFKEKELLGRELAKKEESFRDAAAAIGEIEKNKKQAEVRYAGELAAKEERIAQLNDLAKNLNQTLEEFRVRLLKMEEDIEGKRASLEETRKESDFIRERFDAEKRMSEKRYKEKLDQYEQVKESYERQAGEYEALKRNHERIHGEWRKEHERAEEFHARWQKDSEEWGALRESLEARLNALTSDVASVSQAYQKSISELEHSLKELAHFKNECSEKTQLSTVLSLELAEVKKNFEETRIRFEENAKELEVASGRLERSQISFEQACSKINVLEAENEQVKQTVIDLSERVKHMTELEALNKRLENQLEVAQRQIKDASAQREQQEMIEKRLRVQNELQEKEALLRQLIEKQEQLEQDVNARQGLIKKVLEDQEALEKEIVKNKQTQKHLQEMSRMKDKNRAFSKPSLQMFAPDSAKEEESVEEMSSSQDPVNS